MSTDVVENPTADHIRKVRDDVCLAMVLAGAEAYERWERGAVSVDGDSPIADLVAEVYASMQAQRERLGE